MKKKILFTEARKKLLILWLCASASIFFIFFVQTMMGEYTTHVEEVWKWLFQFIIPPLSLMIGVFIAQATSTAADFETDFFYFQLSRGISLFFLVILFLSAILVPVMHLQENAHLEIESQLSIMIAFNSYNNFLLPLQGFSTLSLGIFFARK